MTSILVFDIETVPDVAGGRRLYELEELSDEETALALFAKARGKTKSDFLPLYLQKIVAISLVLNQNSLLKVWSLGSEQSKEKELIQRFFSGVEKYKPTLVSWNGCGFDLPVLHYRALLHGVAAPSYWETGENEQSFRWNNYLNRFHYRHLDLMDVLAGYQNKAFAPLDELATLLGFPGKMGMNGSQVWQEFLAGNLKQIRDYCETDVLNTYCLYLRFELMRGVFNPEEYQQALYSVCEYLKSAKDKAHFQAFLQKMHPQ